VVSDGEIPAVFMDGWAAGVELLLDELTYELNKRGNNVQEQGLVGRAAVRMGYRWKPDGSGFERKEKSGG
jgi:hypothetical protein